MQGLHLGTGEDGAGEGGFSVVKSMGKDLPRISMACDGSPSLVLRRYATAGGVGPRLGCRREAISGATDMALRGGWVTRRCAECATSLSEPDARRDGPRSGRPSSRGSILCVNGDGLDIGQGTIYLC